jgi:hypothetical protein
MRVSPFRELRLEVSFVTKGIPSRFLATRNNLAGISLRFTQQGRFVTDMHQEVHHNDAAL